MHKSRVPFGVLLLAIFLLTTCQRSREVRIELLNDTPRPLFEVEAKIGKARVATADLTPGTSPGPKLLLRTRDKKLSVELLWRDGSRRCAWVGSIDTAQSQDVLVSVTDFDQASIKSKP